MSDTLPPSCPLDSDARRALWDRIDQHTSQISALNERIAKTEQRNESMESRLDRQEGMILRGQELQQQQYGELISMVRTMSDEISERHGAKEQRELDQHLALKRIGIVLTVIAVAATLGWLGSDARGDDNPAGANPLPEPPPTAEQPAILKDPKRRVRSED